MPTTKRQRCRLKVELDRETDGRWIADIPQLPGVMVYGATRREALVAVKALAFRALADALEHGEAAPDLDGISFMSR
ncbi:MAG: type II toxin-antitoxin system HicB family antitoxin [Planctomycetes bacterium]|nr:type II toxin-antitoxin system HicB family antitoxin [Planctomycetota bacterium]